MKRRLTTLFTLLLTLALLLTACGKNSSDAGSSATGNNAGNNASDSADSSTDDAVVATVNGTDIYYSALAKQMVTIESMYSSLTGTLSAEEINAKLTEQAKSVLENLIAQVILEQKVAEYGLTLTAEQEAEVAGAWEDVKERFAVTVQANYPSFTGEDLDAMVIMSLEASGFTEEMVMDSARTSALIANLKEHVNGEIPAVSDAEIRELYNTMLAEQKTEFDSNASAFEAAMLGSEVVVYIPADYRVIHEWELRFDDENIALLKQMQEIDTEESTAYEDVLASERAIVDASAAAILARIASGSSFDEVFAELNSGMTPKVNYISRATTRFSEEYYSAAMSIETKGGTARKTVPLDYGCYLLCWADTLSAGEIALDEVSEDLSAQLLTEKQSENWKAVQAKWREEAQVTIDEALITY